MELAELKITHLDLAINIPSLCCSIRASVILKVSCCLVTELIIGPRTRRVNKNVNFFLVFKMPVSKLTKIYAFVYIL